MRVGGVRLRWSDEWRGSIRLLDYQAKAERTGSKIMVLKAPTGAGKTLACALRAYSYPGKLSLFLYPTSALASHQAWSIAGSMSAMGVKAGVVDSDGTLRDPKGEAVGDAEVIVAVATSRQLDVLQRAFRLGTHGETLLRLRRMLDSPSDKRLFLLSSPELLYMLLKGYPVFRRHRVILKDVLGVLGAVVIDEFHLYYGFTLANTLNMVFLLRETASQIIFSSATPSSTRILPRISRDVEIVEAEPSPEGRTIRFETELKTASVKAEGPLYSRAHLEKILKHVEDAWKWARGRGGEAEVKTLVLVNSVVFAENLYRTLSEVFDCSVERVHGFVPTEARRFEADILVGTRAIDIGIDFDAASVVFEALSSSDFIQRLGRGSRKREGYATAIIPGVFSRAFKDRLKNSMKYHELVRVVEDVFPPEEAYSRQALGYLGGISYLSILYTLHKELDLGGRAIPLREFRRWLFTLIGEKSLPRPSYLEVDLMDVFLNFYSLDRILESLSRSGFRGEILTVRAYVKNFGLWGDIQLLDLWKLTYKVREDDKGVYVEVEDLTPAGPAPMLMCDHKVDVPLPACGSCTVKYGDPMLEREANKLLSDRLVYHTRRVIDWRFPTVYSKTLRNESYKAVIGPDSILQYLLEREQQ